MKILDDGVRHERKDAHKNIGGDFFFLFSSWLTSVLFEKKSVFTVSLLY